MRFLLCLAVLSLPVLGQIGGYFKLGPVPEVLYEGQSFEVTVFLEVSAREDVKLQVRGQNLSVTPEELTIPKGSKSASFTAEAGFLPVDVRVAPYPVGATLTVEGAKGREIRSISILPRGYRP